MTKLRRQSLTAYAAAALRDRRRLPGAAGQRGAGPHRALRRLPFRPAHAGRLFHARRRQDSSTCATGRTLPFTLGHEIAGVVERAGPGRRGRKARRQGRGLSLDRLRRLRRLPGRRGKPLLAPTAISASPADGGFASHVLVPHPRYLIDYAPLSPSFAGALMCSGLTAYSALKRLQAHAARGPVLLVGLGGVGMMGLCDRARACLRSRRSSPTSTPASARRRSRPAPPRRSIRPTAKRAARSSRRPAAACSRPCDFVGSEKSLAFATGALAKGGKVVVTGLLGGSFPTPVDDVRAQGHDHRGHADRHAAGGARADGAGPRRKAAPLPIDERPLNAAQAALDDLRAGRVVGRVVLVA